MKRLIIKMPENVCFEDLTPVQKSAIENVFSQWVTPMSGTKSHGGYKIVGALVNDNFNPVAIDELELPFAVMGAWQWSGHGDIVELQPLDAGFIDFLPDVQVYDPITLTVASTSPPTLHIPHNWDGWPDVVL